MIRDSEQTGPTRQDKMEEIRFFSEHAKSGEYDVFTSDTNAKIVQSCLGHAKLRAGARVFDLGCGSGVFTELLVKNGLRACGLDISHPLAAVGKRKDAKLALVVGDVEELPIASERLDGVLLSGVVHHLPDVRRCAQEVFRVLKAGGVFVAFDPNRLNPFMWLYRDRSSPFRSGTGVTRNERPVVAREVRQVFRAAGFEARTAYLSGLHYKYVASARIRWALPVYNLLDSVLFRPSFLQPLGPFVLTIGRKP
ncbi:MAG: class I SAM-dependent methyltransferase [Candidatus Rokubacteria bacterium]|nr:class I SAM-dependent methyltransferase [Candidatus Rokubacteria bacterium]MBI3456119.1 class I SAM-dependent methyltransferase [Candidatus Rokubacteria bacterium]